MPSNAASPDAWSSEDKFKAVMETYSLTEAELSEYCRKKGLYPELIEQWRVACIQGNATAEVQSKQHRVSQRKDKKRIKKLEAELRRKNDALAETTALLALSKKLEAFWGTNEDE